MNERESRTARAAIAFAIELAGGATALATAIGCSKSAVSQWIVCPPSRVIEIEKLTGVSRTKLRPDYYPTTEQK